MRRRVFLRAMVGIGDNLYARPFVRDMAEVAEVSLMTGFPQLFEDIRGIRMVRAQTSLPYVQNNIRLWGETHDWRGAPRVDKRDGPKMEPSFISYDPNDPTNVVEQIAAKFPTRRPIYHDLPAPNEEHISPYLRALFASGKKYAIIRPVVVREGFGTTARNCLPGYIYNANEALQAAGYLTIGVASIGKGEMGVAPLPNCDINYMDGVLSIQELIELFRNATAVVSGPGFAMPMAVAAHRPLLAIWGARGALDNPGRIFHSSMNLGRVTNAIPADFCKHPLGECDCLKTIPDFERKLYQFVKALPSA